MPRRLRQGHKRTSSQQGENLIITKPRGVNFEPIIGLEIHVELGTQTKLFCGCPNRFGQSPNSQVCPVCLGLPGVLPVVNQKAIELLLRAGLALGCRIPKKSKFDRKNYFYPDMPKNYQISQYDLPFALKGHITIGSGSQEKKIEIHRIHLEEDTGKSIHVSSRNSAQAGPVVGGRIGGSMHTFLDYNRAGIPLIEVVTEPDLRSPQEAVDFLQKLRRTLQFLEVSDCKMEEGRMRCDANISLRPKENQVYGTKIEIKNMNSFKNVKDALTHEIERQDKALSEGKKLIQETRGWDEEKKITFSMRSKEEAHDYRYFPEPDLPSFEISQTWLEELKSSLPELPETKSMRYQSQYGLSGDEAEFLVNTRSMAEFFDQSVALKTSPKEICNWLRGDLSKYLNEHGMEIHETRLTPEKFSRLLSALEKGTLSGKMAKELLPEMLAEGKDPDQLIHEKGLSQISDPENLKKIVVEVLNDPASGKAVGEYKAGKQQAFGFLVGAIMKKSGGKANPQMTNEILKKLLT